MSNKQLLLKIFSFLIIPALNFQISLYSEEIKAKEIWRIKASYSWVKPYLSPDGEYVAWDDGYKGIFIAKVGTKKKEKLRKTKELFGWLNNEYLITAEGFLSIKTKKTLPFLPQLKGKNILLRIADIPTNCYPYSLNIEYSKQLYPLWVIENGKVKRRFSSGYPFNFSLYKDEENKKIIVFANGIPVYEKENTEFIFDFFSSPFQDKYIVRTKFGNAVVIYPKEHKIYTLPHSCRFSWSPDGKKLIFEVTKDDGHFITEGELFICDWNGKNIKHIKFEKKRIRHEPSFGPPDMITYVIEDENHKIVWIGVAKLILVDENTKKKILRLIKQLPYNPSEAGFSLGEEFGIAPLPYLIEPLKKGNSKVKHGVYKALERIVWRKLQEEPLLKKNGKEINYYLLPKSVQDALKEAVEIAIKDAKQYPDCEIRKKAISFLKLIDEPRVISLLKELLKDPDLSIRKFAVYQLSQLGEKYDIFEVLTGKKPQTPEEYAIYLDNEHLYSLAMKELLKFGKKSIPALLILAKENKEPARQRAITLLGKMKAEEAIPVFENYLKEETKSETVKNLQIKCIEALSAIGTEKTKDIIAKYGLNSKNWEVQLTSAKFLIKTERDKVMKTLKKLLKRENPELKLKIAKLLVKNKEKEGIDILIELLKNPRVSRSAAIYLEIATGKNFGKPPCGIITKKMLEEYVNKWKKWWEENRDSFKFPEN